MSKLRAFVEPNSRKRFASVMSIQVFFADNLGRDCRPAFADALTPCTLRRSVII